MTAEEIQTEIDAYRIEARRAAGADTNVALSALLWGGTPGKLIDAALSGQVLLVTSFAVVGRVTGHPRARQVREAT